MTSPARFRAACRLLRAAGALDHGKTLPYLPGQRAGESAIDWLVRLRLAQAPQLAAEALLLAGGHWEDWQIALDLLAESEPDGSQPTGGADPSSPQAPMSDTR